ncbi:uncharacterized protein LOC125067092 [Vanessa atalanta]|uniref:uncharacterized protein LOC125067092 n=1 Tax=Vanessa atalanta TaxID=42275 RepID=UPI001FCD4C79|nr:uncharacterized protein LOC125067092 [Vanessa atalanta]
MYLSISVALIYFISDVSSSGLISPCKKTDIACIEKSVNDALPQIIAGIPELGVESTDPQALDYIEGNLSMLKYKLYNSTLFGYKLCKIENLKFNDDYNVQCDAKCPKFSMNGQYEMEGRLIKLPIKGKGDYLLSSPDYLINVNTELERVKETDGKTHFVIKNMTFVAQPLSGLQFEFKNLFNGQKDLAEAVHKYAVENWKEVCLLMQDPIWSASIVKIVSNFNEYLKHNNFGVHPNHLDVMYLPLLLTFFFASGVFSGSLITPCPKSDITCIEKSLNVALPKICDGIPELGVEPSDPQFIPFVDGDLSTFNDDFTAVQCDMNCPELMMVGQYDLTGQLISLPVEGKGDFTFVSREYLLKFNVKLEKKQESDGKTHLFIKKINIIAKPLTSATYDFKNLYNGQKDLADNLKNFVKQNWQTVAELVQYPICGGSCSAASFCYMTFSQKERIYDEHAALPSIVLMTLGSERSTPMESACGTSYPLAHH